MLSSLQQTARLIPITLFGHGGTSTGRDQAVAVSRLVGNAPMMASALSAVYSAALDLLVPGEHADDVARIMRTLGYRELHRSADAANYAADEARLGRGDFLFARRRYSRAMLTRARPRRLGSGIDVRVVEPEDLIGLKVQASSNNPQRLTWDLADIERLLHAHPALDRERVREYFRLFGREPELDALLARQRR